MLKDTLPLSLLGDAGELCLGVIFCRYFQMILNHFENKFLFLDIINHPDDLKGQITFSKSFLYNRIRIKNANWGILWLVLFVLVGHLFFLGAVFGTLMQLYFVSKIIVRGLIYNLLRDRSSTTSHVLTIICRCIRHPSLKDAKPAH
jgi:hypothetical protein